MVASVCCTIRNVARKTSHFPTPRCQSSANDTNICAHHHIVGCRPRLLVLRAVAQENIELKFIRHTRPAELALSVPEFPCCAKQKSRLDGFGRLFSWWGRRAVFGGLPAAV